MARPQPNRGEVWIVDLGLAGKRRPCLVLSVPIDDNDHVLATCVQATTSRIGSRFEVEARSSFLRQSGVFNAQELITVPYAKLDRKIGTLKPDELSAVEDAVKRWLGFVPNSP